jgi:hypothetical protein
VGISRFFTRCSFHKNICRACANMPVLVLRLLHTWQQNWVAPCRATLRDQISTNPICVSPVQGCQMVCFQTKIPNLGKFGMDLDWKMLIYFMLIWYILQILGYFITTYLVHFVFIWYIFPVWVSCTKKNLATQLLSLNNVRCCITHKIPIPVKQTFTLQIRRRALGTIS